MSTSVELDSILSATLSICSHETYLLGIDNKDATKSINYKISGINIYYEKP